MLPRRLLIRILASQNAAPEIRSIDIAGMTEDKSPLRRMTWLTASNDQCSGEAIAISCIVCGKIPTGTQMPPIAERITIETEPNGNAWFIVLKRVPTKNPYAVAAKPIEIAMGSNSHE